ncbi:MAG: hypothetical protein A2528_03670 [Candidatus Staskawiczbacteria bacterium RIFOXYD2_FULL_37_9]|uniref:Uncharacterized protein n=1 Tax=Candidatus Staskawiczbacteria bacterium RIFOXYB1_FULL_37_44 TaxID=1802223 RepID=A0A1G2IXL8_9BACT|nr:MAG: hypothetical protein A2358_03730 [Candidatus Staskawiczbacteria bacterium RIFOXYB1_FULL_37_44]OGZ84130.1 MAG: hypothetical protein A2416_03545 [Candidatus Staskawiczbacteria bacterium RIFOXYC1_FULL_37_52]OGZ88723.1 MAG: hypothetical protein A2444_00920 [Candidatus Staskawiczbacteria bacterium RIFOXYC2_FULL_37_19]OGZ89008.1 MAG: hypothetical protein A2581_00250 [Candidatus Staskawiczbacteria bacterium RIFOXYD1_FULL_37_110]OGZ94602.1 MAG: hypothetical protein A2528_03670 [Candidatus Stask
METKKTIYIITSAFFLAAVFLAMFVIYPLSQEISQKSNELIMQKDSRLFLEGQFNEVKSFKEKYADYRQNLDKIDGLFVDSQNPVGFIEYLEKIASELGVDLKISAPTLSKESSVLYENFQFSSSGSFSGTLKFIGKLESGPYLIQIQNINIGSNKGVANAEKQAALTGVKSSISIKALAK